MPARSAVAAASLAAAALLCTAAPAAASPDGKAFFERSGENIRLFIEITQNSMQFFEITLPDGAPALTGIQPLTPGTCTPTAPRRAECDLAFPSGPGDTTGATIQTQDPFPDNTGGQVKLCFDAGCGPGLNRTIAVTGPGGGTTPPPGDQPPPGGPPPSGGQPVPQAPCTDGLPRPCADLEASVVRGGEPGRAPVFAGGVDERTGLASVAIIVSGRAVNLGPDDADPAFVRLEAAGPLTAPPAVPLSAPISQCGGSPDLVRATSVTDSLDCLLGGMRPGDEVSPNAIFVLDQAGVYSFFMTVGSDVRDPNGSNNVASAVIDVPVLPEARFARDYLEAAQILHGRSQGAAQVDVAVARQQGATVATGARARKRGCRWLTSTRVKFRRERGRTCDEPTWLTAKGAKRWRLKLRRELPPGRYTVLARAIGESGAFQVTHSVKDGNQRTFRVKRRKRGRR